MRAPLMAGVDHRLMVNSDTSVLTLVDANSISATTIGTYTPALDSDITVYVNSSTGSDTNTGTSAAPFQTLSRAWDERNRYGILRAKFIVQLVGAGPYTVPLMGASVCGTGGAFILRGDTASEVVSYSGTFTGNITASTGVVGTSAGLGTDTHRGKFVRITSGALIGAIFQIGTHTDTTINVLDWTAWASLSTANGDTFSVFLPGTSISFSPAGSGQPTPCPTDWVGGAASVTLQSNPPQHIFFDLAFTLTATFINAAVTLIACKSAGSIRVLNSRVLCGYMSNGFALGIGANTLSNLITGAGLSCSNSGGVGYIIDGGSTIAGVLYVGTQTITLGSTSSTDYAALRALRAEGQCNVNSGMLELSNGTFGMYRFQRQISVVRGGRARLSSSTAPCTFVLTTGSCLRASYGGQIYVEGTGITGGTTSASGFGGDATDGGAIYWKNQLPTLTGGTAGADLKVTAVAAVANATLAANGNALSTTTAGSQTGDVIARVN